MSIRESQATRDPVDDARALEARLFGAADAAAAELPAVDARAMARRAMSRAATEQRARSRRRAIGGGLLLAAAIGLGVVVAVSAIGAPGASTPAPVASSRSSSGAARTELPTGDLVWAAARADYHVVSAAPEQREIRVSHGEVLFDVRPLGADERFVVRTAHGEVRVRGTVFSVRAAHDRTIVRVFEGHVEVERRDGHVEHLRAGAASAFVADAEISERPDEGELDAIGGERARRRSAPEPIAVAQSSPPSEPTSAETPIPSQPASTAAEAPVATLDGVRRWLVRGQYDRAIREARRHEGGEWREIEGDAARALHDDAAAARAYERAAAELPPRRAALAGYLGARIRFSRLHDRDGALRLLTRSRAAEDASPVLERALLLAARIHRQGGDMERARAVAARYLSRFPNGSGAAEMRSIVTDDAAP